MALISNPEWVTEAVYTLIDTREIQDNKGRFISEDLKTYWDLNKYPRDKHMELIRLMEKFELCFNLVDTDSYIIPELLPADRPPIPFEKYKNLDNLLFEYQYDFMPEGIISRFISRVYYLIKEDHFWKNGVELRFEDSCGLVISEPLTRKMKISVSGSCKSELLGIIRNEMEHIHKTLNMEKGKHYHEMIPCTCAICLESKEPHLYNYEVLKRRFTKRGFINYCQKSDEEVPIERLLKGFEREKPLRELDLLKTLIATASQLQGIAKSLKPEEDSRNDFIARILDIKGFIVKDHSRWGRSASGKSIGRPDFKIENPEGEAVAMMEAFNLRTIDRTVIDKHLKKIFGYDPSGLEQNFILVYSVASDFSELWKKYLNYIPKIDFEYPLIGSIKGKKTQFTDIKLACATHEREGKTTEVYHMFINLKG